MDEFIDFAFHCTTFYTILRPLVVKKDRFTWHNLNASPGQEQKNTIEKNK